MMRSAIVKDGVVVNVIIGTLPDSIPCGDAVGLGWLFDGETFTGPPVDTPSFVPSEVNRRQILTALGLLGWITEAEAEAALTTGSRPVAVEAIVSEMPENQRFAARMKWAGFQVAYPADPMVTALAAHEGKSDSDIATLFTLAAQIV